MSQRSNPARHGWAADQHHRHELAACSAVRHLEEPAMTDAPLNRPPVTAAILVIGDEILSGRTKDKNIGYIAEYLTNIGI